MDVLRVVVVENGATAREPWRARLGAQPDVEVLAICHRREDALRAIRDLRPDLVLVDLAETDSESFGIIDAVGPDLMPATIFVTSDHEHALRAFEVQALDCLIRPFSDARLERAIAHARLHCEAQREERLAQRLLSLVHELKPNRPAADRFLVKSGGRIIFVQQAEIDSIESDGNYVRLHVGGRAHLVRETMGSIESRLGERFCRVHRTRIVNLDRVKELQLRGNGEYELVMQDGVHHRVGRAYRDLVQTRLEMGV
jgi:two-component system, LytTR family, response regulator